MRRREFIQCMLPVAGLPIVFPMWSVKNAFGMPRLQKFQDVPVDDRVLVIVQLAGGNDGLNTIIPHTQDLYYNNRPNIGIQPGEVIDLNGEIGLHPMLQKIQRVYDSGDLAVVQGVGYPNPNRSHFKSTDIWLTASDSNDLKDTGWLGRYFDQVCPPDQTGKINCGSFGPPAIQIGLTSSLALLGKNPRGISLQDPLAFYNLVMRQGDTHGGNQDVQPQTAAERELYFLRETAAAAFEYAEEILAAFNGAANTVEYPNQSLAAQLAVVAKLIAGGLTTRVYIVSIKGFDTHAAQLGRHETLLQEVAAALSSFQADLENLQIAGRVVGLCFSEFGRRVHENGSAGTDHGTAAPMLLFGRPVAGGIYGVHPDLRDLDFNGDLKFQFDFRQIYATILERWLAADSASILGGTFTPLGFIDSATHVGANNRTPHDFYLSQNYPNPFNPSTAIEYALPENLDIELAVYSATGRKVRTLYQGHQSAGVHQLIWNAGGLASGTYFLRLRGRSVELIRSMQLIK